VVFRRLASVLAVAASCLALLGLASCRSDPNVAAYVGDKQITIDQVDGYYAKAAKDSLSSQLVSQQPKEIKPALVSLLIYTQLFRATADQNHVTVSAGQIAQAKAAVAPQRSGITNVLALLPLDDLAELEAYQEQLSAWAAAGGADQTAAGAKLQTALRASLRDNPVTVNPRFGKFDPNKIGSMIDAQVAVASAASPSTAP
jgi:hypothetical protein